MSSSTLVVTTTPTGVRPRLVNGREVQTSAAQLLSVMRSRLGDDFAHLLARPVQQPSTNEVSWYSALTGPVEPLSERPTAEREAVLAQVQARFERMRELGNTLSAAGGAGARLGSALSAVSQAPTEDDVFLVDGKPVVVGWGYESDPHYAPPAAPLPARGATMAAASAVPEATAASAVLAETAPAHQDGPRNTIVVLWRWVALLPLVAVLAVLGWFALQPLSILAVPRDRPPPDLSPALGRELEGIDQQLVAIVGLHDKADRLRDKCLAEEVARKAEEEKRRLEEELARREAEEEQRRLEEAAKRKAEEEAKQRRLAEIAKEEARKQERRRLAQIAEREAQEQRRLQEEQQRLEALARQKAEQRRPKLEGKPTLATEYCPRDKIEYPETVLVYDNSGSMDAPLNAPEHVIAQFEAEVRAAKLTAGLLQLVVGSSARQIVDNVIRKHNLQRYGNRRTVEAKRTVRQMLKSTPRSAAMGMVAFSHCDQMTRIPVGRGSAHHNRIQSTVNGLHPSGGTPIAASLAQAAGMIDGTSAAKPGTIILLTDGVESCSGDPCAMARRIRQQKPYTTIHVIKLGPEPSSLCVAEATGGAVYQPSTVSELAKALRDAPITSPFELQCNE